MERDRNDLQIQQLRNADVSHLSELICILNVQESVKSFWLSLDIGVDCLLKGHFVVLIKKYKLRFECLQF